MRASLRRTLYLTGSLSALLWLSTSCASRKDFVYVNDLQPQVDYPANIRHEAVIQSNDRLAITVSSKNPELALPFNRFTEGINVKTDGTVTANESAASDKGYRVDAEGVIEFPLLGKLHVAGLTAAQATELIKTRIIEGNYIKEPLVSIEFLNMRYTVLGAVNGTGTYNMGGDRVTLLEAIAKAGDLQQRANLERVSVIREEGGVRRVYTHDIRQKNIFDSPAYYLRQNDIVYVEPKYKKQDSEDNLLKYSGIIISVASLACSLIWALK